MVVVVVVLFFSTLLNAVGGVGMACQDRTEEECAAVMADLDKRMLSWTDYGDAQDYPWNPSPKQQLDWSRTHAV